MKMPRLFGGNERGAAKIAEPENPPHTIGVPDDDKLEQDRIALYDYHKSAGSLGTYFEQYPTDPRAAAFYRKVDPSIDKRARDFIYHATHGSLKTYYAIHGKPTRKRRGKQKEQEATGQEKLDI